MLVGNTSASSFKGFRFESFWHKLETLWVLETVEEAWNKPLSVFNPFLRLHTKLQRTSVALRKLTLWILDVGGGGKATDMDIRYCGGGTGL
jgi:hypothetical protein